MCGACQGCGKDVEGVYVEDVCGGCVWRMWRVCVLRMWRAYVWRMCVKHSPYFNVTSLCMPVAYVGVGRRGSILGNLLLYTILQFYETTVSSITKP